MPTVGDTAVVVCPSVMMLMRMFVLFNGLAVVVFLLSFV